MFPKRQKGCVNGLDSEREREGMYKEKRTTEFLERENRLNDQNFPSYIKLSTSKAKHVHTRRSNYMIKENMYVN